MLSILFLQFFIPLIFSLLIFVAFQQLKLNNRISRKRTIRVDFLIIGAIFIVFTFFVRPNIFEKIETYNSLRDLSKENIAQIEIIRFKRNDSLGQINYLKKKFNVTKIDSIGEFLNLIKSMTFDFPQRPGNDGYSWRCQIQEEDGNILYLRTFKNKNKIYVTPFTKHGTIGFYSSRDLLYYFRALENK